MNDNELQSKLAEPFSDDDIEWRVQRCGKKDGKVWAMIVPYIQARAIMNRLDDLVGIAGWSDSYSAVQTPEPGIACRLTIHRADKPSITKEDAAECTNIHPVKGGYSDALKRAAVKFGMGRYLYDLEPVFASDIQDKRIKGGIPIYDKTQEINCWCPRPSLNGKQNRGNEPSAKDDLVSEVVRLVNEILESNKKFTMNHRKASMKKHLDITEMSDLAKCPEEALAKYIEHLKEKLS